MSYSKVHSKQVNGSLVYWQGHRSRWIEAIGQDVLKYCNHFGTPIPTDDSTGDPTEWTCTVVEVGAGTSTVVNGTTEDGDLLITTAGNENDGLNMQHKGERFKLEANKPCYFGIRIKISEATQTDLLVGLCITDTTLLGGVSDGAYFECLDGGTGISFVTEKNSTETQVDSLGTMDTSYHIYEFYWDGSTYIHAYLDGTLVTSSSTNLPNDEALTPSIHFLNGSAAARTANIDWIRVIQIR